MQARVVPPLSYPPTGGRLRGGSVAANGVTAGCADDTAVWVMKPVLAGENCTLVVVLVSGYRSRRPNLAGRDS